MPRSKKRKKRGGFCFLSLHSSFSLPVSLSTSLPAPSTASTVLDPAATCVLPASATTCEGSPSLRAPSATASSASSSSTRRQTLVAPARSQARRRSSRALRSLL